MLIRAEDDGDQLTNAELVAMATLLLGAGFETTRNGIAGGILALLTHPDELAQLRADPSLDKPMADEVLRFVSPNQTAVGALRARRRRPVRHDDPEGLGDGAGHRGGEP